MDDVLKLGFLGSLQRSGIIPGLESVRALTAAFGDPQLKYPVVLVTGTNGKGSTTCFIDSILRAAGYRTGRFTSPHLVDVRERIFIDGAMIGAEQFDELGMELRSVVESGPSRPTFFEALTVMGFLAFARSGVDAAVVEIGMGGRYDSTNVAEPVVSVLTNVGLDHVGFLGATREAIAAEKVGIARAGKPFVTGVDEGLYLSTVGPALTEIGAVPFRSGVDFSYSRSGTPMSWHGCGVAHGRLVPGLPGDFQYDNLSLAVAAVECLRESVGFRIDDDAFVKGASSATWPARFQKVASDPDTIVDGCHNVHAAESLVRDMARLARPLILVHGTKPEKDYDGVLALLVPMADGIVETGFEGGADPVAVAEISRRYAHPGVPVEVAHGIEGAVARARALAGESGTVLIAGSLYLAGAAIAKMGWKV